MSQHWWGCHEALFADSAAIALHRYGAGPVGFILAVLAARVPWAIPCQSGTNYSSADVFTVAAVAGAHPAVVGLSSSQNAANHAICIVCSHPCLPFFVSRLASIWCIYAIKSNGYAAHFNSISVPNVRNSSLDFFSLRGERNAHEECCDKGY